jgi:hypothetical protein
VRNDSEVLVDEAAKRVRSLLSGPLEVNIQVSLSAF